MAEYTVEWSDENGVQQYDLTEQDVKLLAVAHNLATETVEKTQKATHRLQSITQNQRIMHNVTQLCTNMCAHTATSLPSTSTSTSTPASNSIAPQEIACLNRCVARYIDAYKLVSAASLRHEGLLHEKKDPHPESTAPE